MWFSLCSDEAQFLRREEPDLKDGVMRELSGWPAVIWVMHAARKRNSRSDCYLKRTEHRHDLDQLSDWLRLSEQLLALE